MLAAHRDQENLVRSHQVATKQQPNTPGARYPKTPLKPGQYDENAPTAFAAKTGKTGLGGARPTGNENIMMTKGKSILTPMEPRTRAPLGAKTTNAKARTGQTGGVKGIVKEIEKTTLKQQPTAMKPKPKSAMQLEVKHDQEETHDDGEEPEYAPPRPVDLPYDSDLLPPGGLSMEGLKKENLFRGYYEHFINPVDENGVSRQDKQFRKEMDDVMEKAIRQNERDLQELDWGLPEAGKILQKKPDAPSVAEAKMARKIRDPASQKQPATVRSRKAATALAQPSDSQSKPLKRPASTTVSGRRTPFSSLLQTNKTSRPVSRAAKPPATTHGTAELASRTTLGYNKGKSASSLVHARAQSTSSISNRTKTPVFRDDQSDRTLTPARAREAGLGFVGEQAEQVRPQFMSIFDREEDDEDLPPMSCPAMPEDEDEEEFELKFDI